MRLQLLLIAIAATAPAVWAQGGIYKDRFLSDYPAGTLGMVTENVASLAEARKLVPTTPTVAVSTPRRSRCVFAVSHRLPEMAGHPSFVGAQVVKLFSQHASPGVVFVGRNEGWTERSGRQQLPVLPMSEVLKASLDAFVQAHSDGKADELGISKGRLHLVWHAQLATAQGATVTDSEEHVRFWQVDPTSDSEFRSVQAAVLGSKPLTRIENHIIRFTMTGDSNPANMPSFHFECKDPRLLAASVRLYVPFSTDFSTWGHIVFK